jgi:hypothetical protein
MKEFWGMGRLFPFEYRQRKLAVAVISIDEGWELWIMEAGRRLARGASVSVDEATDAGRRGGDRILEVAEQLKFNVINAVLQIEGPVSRQSTLATTSAAR